MIAQTKGDDIKRATMEAYCKPNNTSKCYVLLIVENQMNISKLHNEFSFSNCDLDYQVKLRCHKYG